MYICIQQIRKRSHFEIASCDNHMTHQVVLKCVDCVDVGDVNVCVHVHRFCILRVSK